MRSSVVSRQPRTLLLLAVVVLAVVLETAPRPAQAMTLWMMLPMTMEARMEQICMGHGYGHPGPQQRTVFS
jgi:hypothetical protein